MNLYTFNPSIIGLYIPQMPPHWSDPFSCPISSCSPSFSSSNVHKAASNGVRLQLSARSLCACESFYCSKISLQLSIIYTGGHTFDPSTHTYNSVCFICTSGCDSVCLSVCAYVWAFISVRWSLIESSIASNDPSSILLFHPDQRAKSCCED